MVRNYKNSNTQPAKRDYSQIFAIIKEINSYGFQVTYKELLLDFTSQKTNSLTSISDAELNEFIQSLIAMKNDTVPTAQDYATDKNNPIRRAIIAQFKSIGSTTEGAIAWAEKYGVKGNKKKFNNYTAQELYLLLQNSKKLSKNFVQQLTKQLSNG